MRPRPFLLLLVGVALALMAAGDADAQLPFGAESTYTYSATVKLVDTGNKTGQGDLGAFQVFAADNEGCFCDVYGGASLVQKFVVDSDRSTGNEISYRETIKVYASEDQDVLLLTLKDRYYWFNQLTYEVRQDGTTFNSYGQVTWNPNNLPKKETTVLPNFIFHGHTNTYMFDGEVEKNGLETYVYVSDETGSAIPIYLEESAPENLQLLMYEYGVTFHVSYYERVHVHPATGTIIARGLDLTIYATFPSFYEPESTNYNYLFLTDGRHYPNVVEFNGTMTDDELDEGPHNIAVRKITQVLDTHLHYLSIEISYEVITELLVGVDGDGNPIYIDIDLNADGVLFSPTVWAINRTTHMMQRDLLFNNADFGPFPYPNIDASSVSYSANPFKHFTGDEHSMEEYHLFQNIYYRVESGEVTHSFGKPVNSSDIYYDPLFVTMYRYVNINDSEVIEQDVTLDNELLVGNGGEWDWHEDGNYTIRMNYTEDVWFDPFTGAIANQMFNLSFYADWDESGTYTVGDDVVRTLDFEYSDDQKANFEDERMEKSQYMFYSDRIIPAFVFGGGYSTTDLHSGIGLPDLYVSRLVVDNEAPSAGDDLVITATVINSGRDNVDVETAFSVAFYYDDIIDENFIGLMTVEGGLVYNSTADVSVVWSNLPQGVHTVIAIVDYVDQIVETSEINTYERQVIVQSGGTVVKSPEAEASTDDSSNLLYLVIGGAVVAAAGGALFYIRRDATGQQPAKQFTPTQQLTAIECPSCNAQMKVPKLGKMQNVTCDSCGLSGEIEV